MKKPVVALFPGQGSQHVGMARELYENFAIVRETFEEASDAIGINLKKLCFEGPDDELILTENTQPCLLTASVAAFRVAQKEIEFKPAVVAGHSLGEYSALVAAHAVRLSDAVRWVKARGAAMQQAVPAGNGTMAAVLNLDDSKIEALCHEATSIAKSKRASGDSPELKVEAIVQPANFNAPGQIVIAGSTDAVAEAITLIKSSGAGGDYAGAKAIALSVSAPFHCSLMKPARDRMASLFAAHQKPAALNCPYVPNRTARISSEPGVIFELLVEQVDHPVLWKQSMTALIQEGFEIGVEFGPGKVLQGLSKRIAAPLEKPFAMSGVNDVANFKSFETIWKGLV
ncbi:MAG: ACP S-malonyltransferase [Methylotenera sp.]|nr:ACP S-malonyltransferase [Oligoflexia bacterium]